MSTPLATPLVRQLAARHRVDLGKVEGTGAGGRITKADVQAAAGVPTRLAASRPQLNPVASLPPVSVRMVEQRSMFDHHQMVRIDPYGRNPLLEDASQASWAYPDAVKAGPAPTLFPGGDLPLFLASGADPQLLLALPWMARHPAALADAEGFAWIMSRVAGPDAVMEATILFGPDGRRGADQNGADGNTDYLLRMQRWLNEAAADARAKQMADSTAEMLQARAEQVASFTASSRKVPGLQAPG